MIPITIARYNNPLPTFAVYIENKNKLDVMIKGEQNVGIVENDINQSIGNVGACCCCCVVDDIFINQVILLYINEIKTSKTSN